MALLYRMGTGNGSGGDLKPYTVNFECASGYIGQTLTMTYKGTPHAGETVDNVSGTVGSDGTLTLYPMHSGEWECSCYSSVTGITMKKTIDLSYWGVHPTVTFEDTPNGATVTPTDDVQTWLHCANVWNKSYTTISEVVADTTTLNILISDNNASDYLARSTTWASDVCSNESAMTYIGLNDYCANKLLADDTWLTAICSTEETLLKKVLTVFVPTLTSNTGSDGGKANSSSQYNSNTPTYNAFDDNYDTEWNGVKGLPQWIQYKFPTKNKVKLMIFAIGISGSSGHVVKDCILQGSDDGTSWTDIKSFTNTEKTIKKDVKITCANNNSAYYYYRFHISTSYTEYTSLSKLQFYGREEA